MKKLALLFLFLHSLVWAGHPFQVEDMQKLKRIGETALSPDNKWIAYTIQTSDVEKNKTATNLWLVASVGDSPVQLTFSEKGSNSRPVWSPDSKNLYFLSTRANDVSQVFRIATIGGEAKQITNIEIGVDSFLLSPDGKTMLITTSVYPECKDLSCNEKKKKENDESPVKARTITSIPFRRWDSWVDGKRNHIFVASSDGGTAKDITPGDVDSPIWTEEGGEEIAFSPDGKEICFARYTENEALTGNSDLFTLALSGGEPKKITTNKAADTTPLYSPDGRYISYLATLRPGTVTDLTRLFLYDRKSGESKNLTESLDRSISSHLWSEDSKTLWITYEDQGQSSIASLDVASGKISKIFTEGSPGNLQVAKDGKFLLFTNMNFSMPVEIFRMNLREKPVAITSVNKDLLQDIDFGQYSSFDFPGAKGETVQCWQVKPPKFDPSKKYPILLLMHGGPENAWDNLFHYRWNAQLFAAAGYVVILPNFHGSSGFGLKFMDAIKGDWGGAPYEDQMKAVDVSLTWPYVDSSRLVAAGASYGGYMANWVEGHTDRFRAIVSHDGLYDLFSSLYSADFIGGIDKEFGGTPWENRQALIDQAPVTFAKNFRTPMLVVHGEKDYRVDPSNALAMFQVLQAMHVPSKLLYFSEENHWVRKPADSILWYHTVLDWLNQWVKPEKAAYEKMLNASRSTPNFERAAATHSAAPLPDSSSQAARQPARTQITDRKLAAGTTGFLDAFLPKTAGNFTLEEIKRDPGTIDSTISDALAATYNSPNGNRVGYGMASLISNQDAHFNSLIQGSKQRVVSWEFSHDILGQVIRIANLEPTEGDRSAKVWSSGNMNYLVIAMNPDDLNGFLGGLISWPKPANRIKWQTDIFKAYSTAVAEKKPLVIYFYDESSDWCKKLDTETLIDDRVNALADRAIFARIDGNKDDDQKNVSKIISELKVESYPYVSTTNPSKDLIKEINNIKGFFEPGAFSKYLIEDLNAADKQR